jgi:hypothetical protein
MVSVSPATSTSVIFFLRMIFGPPHHKDACRLFTFRLDDASTNGMRKRKDSPFRSNAIRAVQERRDELPQSKKQLRETLDFDASPTAAIFNLHVLNVESSVQ